MVIWRNNHIPAKVTPKGFADISSYVTFKISAWKRASKAFFGLEMPQTLAEKPPTNRIIFTGRGVFTLQ